MFSKIISLFVLFTGPGQKIQDVINIKGALELLPYLKGPRVELYRSKAVNILNRYLAGDRSMHSEIKQNAVSSNPVNVMARSTLAAEGNQLTGTTRMREVEDDEISRQERVVRLKMMEAQLESTLLENKQTTIKTQDLAVKHQENVIKIQDLAMKHQENAVKSQINLMEMYAKFCPDNKVDDRMRVQFKDIVMNIVTAGPSGFCAQFAIGNGTQLAIENNATGGVVSAAGSASNQNNPITISTVASQMGYCLSHSDSIAIGKKVVKEYQKIYGKKPEKHEQFVDGAVRMVNNYTERDRPLIEKIIRSHFEGSDCNSDTDTSA
jgi:hypothetical protein